MIAPGTSQGVGQVMVHLKDKPIKAFAIGAKLYLWKMSLKVLSTDPIERHASYFLKIYGVLIIRERLVIEIRV